jgi:hypothetical protein
MTPVGAAPSACRCVAIWAARWRIALTALLCLPAPALAQAAPAALPYQVEAVFLFNFTQFVTWPAEAFRAPGDPFVICIVGEDPFGSYLDETVAGEKVQDRPLQVRRLQRLDPADHCHIAFVSGSESARVAELLGRLQGPGTLTVSDIEDFGKRGGMIRFVVENRRVRLRVNVDAAKAAGLTISSKLLRIADIVTERP